MRTHTFGHLLPHMVVAESSFERPVRSETSPSSLSDLKPADGVPAGGFS